MSAPTAEPTAESAPGLRRRRILPIVLISIAVLLVAIIGAATAYIVSIDRSVTENIVREDTLPDDDPSTGPRPTKEPSTTGTLNYVLLGSDSRDPGNAGNGRSDSMMIVHLNKARNRAYIISFPRDMWVDVPGYGMNKINAAYAHGGPKLTVRTLESLTGARMDHVVQIDFEGFIGLTEDLGGITVKNETDLTSHGYHYPKGDITIAGGQALWFVRERHALPQGDLDRAENQRKVIRAIVRKGLSAEVVADPVRFTAFVGGVAKHLSVDSTLSDAEIRETAISMRLKPSSIVLLQAPISGFGTVNGQSVDLVDEAVLAELSTALREDTMAQYAEKYPGG